MKIRFVSVLLTLLLASFSEAEVLHKWFESDPDHSYQYGDVVDELFNTYTSKDASRTESDGSWQLTASATALANCRAPIPRGEDLRTAFDAHALVRATGDKDTLEPHSGDGFAKTENGVKRTLTSADGTTTASTKRIAHVVSYQNRAGRDPLQRFMNVSTSGGKSETSVSRTELDADPWGKSWLEVKRRVALNNEVSGSPFSSTTPDCTSSGNGHTCEGAQPPPKKKEKVYCRRGDACQNKPGVEGDRDAHKIKCPEKTYKQGIWSWLMIKLKEDCKGEKWSCHSDPANCTRKHLHLKDASKAAAGETVFNGYVVPAGYSVGACGEHLYPSSGSASDHASKSGDCGHSYSACTPGDHDKLQASCSTDSNCISTSFYLCQHTSHEYAPPPPPAMRQCGRHTKAEGGDHRYIRVCAATNANGARCTRTSIGYWACDPHTHVYPESPPPSPPPPATVSCGRSACTASVSSSTEHRVGPCNACGKSYWSCGQYGSYHENQCCERTCRYGAAVTSGADAKVRRHIVVTTPIGGVGQGSL